MAQKTAHVLVVDDRALNGAPDATPVTFEAANDAQPRMIAYTVQSVRAAAWELERRWFDAVLFVQSCVKADDLREFTQLATHALGTIAIVGMELDDPALELAAIRAGAQDCVYLTETKPQDLSRRIMVAVERAETRRAAFRGSDAADLATVNAAAEAKAAFLANMSHELHTPLNCVLGYLDFILTEQHGPIGRDKYKEAAEIAQSASRDLLEMISDIVQSAKTEAEMSNIKSTEFSVDGLIRECLTTVSPLLRQASLTAEAHTSSLRMSGDAKRYKQVLLNLLSNAMKFTDAGGAITISTEIQSDGGLEVCVADTGAGIAPQDIPKLFKRFQQVDGARETDGSGAGLGLSIARQFVEQHGGKLRAASTPGEGSRFTFSVPAERIARAEVIALPIAFRQTGSASA